MIMIMLASSFKIEARLEHLVWGACGIDHKKMLPLGVVVYNENSYGAGQQYKCF